MSLCLAFVLVLAAGPPPAEPPSPKTAAARASMRRSLPAPAPRPSPRGERFWLPRTLSVTRDPGFTPWTTFLSLRDGPIGTWALEGTSLAGGLGCADQRAPWCESFAQAILALVWQPDASPVAVYGGMSVTSLGTESGMEAAPGASMGLRITLDDMASLVRRWRARR